MTLLLLPRTGLFEKLSITEDEVVELATDDETGKPVAVELAGEEVDSAEELLDTSAADVDELMTSEVLLLEVDSEADAEEEVVDSTPVERLTEVTSEEEVAPVTKK
jgi:hypothetical protein